MSVVDLSIFVKGIFLGPTGEPRQVKVAGSLLWLRSTASCIFPTSRTAGQNLLGLGIALFSLMYVAA